MRLNWNPQNTAFLDFETQSRSPLSSAHKYAKHESTKALTCVVKTEDSLYRMGPYLTSADCETLRQIAQTHTMVAHNAAFDAAIWEHTLHLPEAEWYDTMLPARAAALPGGLDAIGQILTGEGKDKNGKMLIDLLCNIRTKPAPPPHNPAYRLLLNYNQRDVELLEQVFHRVHGYGEPKVMTADFAVNQRGIPIDRPFLEALRDVYEKNEEYAEAEFDKVTGGVNPRSSKQVTAWLSQLGFSMTSLNKAAVRDLIAYPERFCTLGDSSAAAEALDVAVELLEHRKEVIGVGPGKVKAALDALEDDGRLRDQFVYYGAGPGRWSGRTLQPHNMPLAVQGLDTRNLEPTFEAVSKAAEESSERLGYYVPRAQVANSMLRHSIRAENLNVADYNAIEARWVAYLAEEPTMLKIYNNPQSASIYLDMGREVFGREITKNDIREYAVSKSLILGCGYGMSSVKFQATLTIRSKISAEVLRNLGIDASGLVKTYRKKYWRIPQLWNEVHRAIHLCAHGEDSIAGRCLFTRVGPDMHIVLPSGRPIVYRNVRIEPHVPGYCKLYGMAENPIDTVVCDSARFRDQYLWGSKVVENMAQGASRDLLANTIVNLESVQIPTVLHVHDEDGNEAPEERFDEFMSIMSEPPAWAPNFPLLVEGYAGPMWTKNSNGYREATYFNGKELKK